jgi:adenosylcobinamide kinase/adenosylcobinamide-phosphate guanylyltransferase
MGKQLTLLLGGARSGKSNLAQHMGQQSGQSVLFVATAAALDAEMAARISAHRAARPSGWQTLEAQSGVGRAIRQYQQPYDFLVLDCITLLVSNCLMALPENAPAAEAHAVIVTEIEELIAAYAASPAGWVIVSNEVGMGLVPPYPLGRVYRDELGYANQRLAQAAGRVALLVAGLPLWLKGIGV